jgi:hypothetical protein
MCSTCLPDNLCDDAMGIFIDDEEACFFCEKIDCFCDDLYHDKDAHEDLA